MKDSSTESPSEALSPVSRGQARMPATTLDLDDGVVVVLDPEDQGSSNDEVDTEANGALEAQHRDDDQDDSNACRCPSRNPIVWAISYLKFGGLKMAQGYNILGTARGPLIMSNIFLSTALIFLASEEVGCTEQDEDGTWVLSDTCEERTYGVFKPAALVTNIAVISGFLSATLMPLTGALIDYTPQRKSVGIASAITLILIQATQIATGPSTWFVMALLQAFAGFFFDVQFLATYAYLPSIARVVSERTMTKHVSFFNLIMFSSEAAFLMVVVGISFLLDFSDVGTARLSQSLNAAVLVVAFYFGWKCMPKVPASRQLPLDPNTGRERSLVAQGFSQIWKTGKQINVQYASGLRWFLLAVMFSEAAAEAFTVVAVVYMNEELGMTTIQVGVFFVIGLVSLIPGTLLSDFITARTNPKMSWGLSMLSLQATAIVGALALNKDNITPGGFIWAVFVGLNLGWFYPAQILFFSMCVPSTGQEAELAGFYAYCTIILAWLPPLIFSVLVEANVDQSIGVIAVSSFFSIGCGFLAMTSPWKEILQEAQAVQFVNDGHETDAPAEPLETANSGEKSTTDSTTDEQVSR